MNSVRTRLVLLFFAITAAAIGFVYLYVVPQLRSSLTAEKLQRLEAVAIGQSGSFSRALQREASRAQLQRLVDATAQKSAARATLLGVRPGPQGLRPEFVIADSQLERTAVLPSYPAAGAAAASGRPGTAVEAPGGSRIGETAIVVSRAGQPRWVLVLSAPLGEVDDNVALIKRQILIAGTIALALALAAGFARAHAQRLRRLEVAAERVADGDFNTPIPNLGTDEVGQLASAFDEMQKRLARLDSARREFIANASHELRTPIFSLGGFVELLEDEDPDPEARAEFVRTMREQIDRLAKLTVELLDLSKLDADAIEFNAGPVDLAGLAARVVEEFAPATELRRSCVSCSTTPSLIHRREPPSQ